MFFKKRIALTFLAVTCLCSIRPSMADRQVAQNVYQQAQSNSEEIPKQILRTGVNLNATSISPNSRQLADSLNLTPLLLRVQQLRGKIDPTNFEPTVENCALATQLTASTVEASQLLQEASLAIDFTIAEIQAEQNIYNELLSNFTGDRDKQVLRTNAVSFILNGALWAICEGYDIPTNRHPNFSITSGTTGILAGVIPSIASIYALYQLNGKRRTSEVDQNMLAKLFDYRVGPDVEYPKQVWDFLSTVPADGSTTSRKEQLIDRWIADKNMPSFTDRKSHSQLDIITASALEKKGLSISSLTARNTMLQQLGSEIQKEKRLLLELSMVVHGEKQI